MAGSGRWSSGCGCWRNERHSDGHARTAGRQRCFVGGGVWRSGSRLRGDTFPLGSARDTSSPVPPARGYVERQPRQLLRCRPVPPARGYGFGLRWPWICPDLPRRRPGSSGGPVAIFQQRLPTGPRPSPGYEEGCVGRVSRMRCEAPAFAGVRGGVRRAGVADAVGDPGLRWGDGFGWVADFSGDDRWRRRRVVRSC